MLLAAERKEGLYDPDEAEVSVGYDDDDDDDDVGTAMMPCIIVFMLIAAGRKEGLYDSDEPKVSVGDDDSSSMMPCIIVFMLTAAERKEGLFDPDEPEEEMEAWENTEIALAKTQTKIACLEQKLEELSQPNSPAPGKNMWSEPIPVMGKAVMSVHPRQQQLWEKEQRGREHREKAEYGRLPDHALPEHQFEHGAAVADRHGSYAPGMVHLEHGAAVRGRHGSYAPEMVGTRVTPGARPMTTVSNPFQMMTAPRASLDFNQPPSSSNTAVPSPRTKKLAYGKVSDEAPLRGTSSLVDQLLGFHQLEDPSSHHLGDLKQQRASGTPSGTQRLPMKAGKYRQSPTPPSPGGERPKLDLHGFGVQMSNSTGGVLPHGVDLERISPSRVPPNAPHTSNPYTGPIRHRHSSLIGPKPPPQAGHQDAPISGPLPPIAMGLSVTASRGR
eukprot:gene15578-21676_t